MLTLRCCLNGQTREKGSESFKRYTVITGSRASSVGIVTGSFPLPVMPLYQKLRMCLNFINAYLTRVSVAQST
jgi:hypothetical protein